MIHQLRTKYRLISGSYGLYDGEPIFEFEESVRGSVDITEEEMLSLRIIHFFTWALWNLGVGKPLLRFLELEHNLNPVDMVLTLAKPGKDSELDEFLAQFNREAQEEWFETAEELVDHYTTNFDQLLKTGFLKMNYKYLAKILLDRDFARCLLANVAAEVNSTLASELVEFCLDRIYFLDEMIPSKDREYSEDLVRILMQIYPNHTFESNTCRFEIEEGTRRQIRFELQKFDFDHDPLRALALTLEPYHSDFLYDFRFGASGQKETVGELMGSFDYHGQLGRGS